MNDSNDKRLLDVRDLSVSFGHAEAESQAVKNLSLTVDRGETVALVGESGSAGKNWWVLVRRYCARSEVTRLV